MQLTQAVQGDRFARGEGGGSFGGWDDIGVASGKRDAIMRNSRMSRSFGGLRLLMHARPICWRTPLQLRLFHNAHSRDSMLMPMDDRQLNLMLQFKIQLIRCEPTTHFNAAGTYCTGNGILHDGGSYGQFHLERWTDREWSDFSRNFANIITRYWDDKFEFTPTSRGIRRARTSPRRRPLIAICRWRWSRRRRAHHRYYIIKPRETTFRSFAAADRRLGLFTHRDLAWLE